MPHIALVDDEQSILTSVSLSLESEGFTVDTFLNGVDALKALESKSYDLGLFDIKMPAKGFCSPWTGFCNSLNFGKRKSLIMLGIVYFY